MSRQRLHDVFCGGFLLLVAVWFVFYIALPLIAHLRGGRL